MNRLGFKSNSINKESPKNGSVVAEWKGVRLSLQLNSLQSFALQKEFSELTQSKGVQRDDFALVFLGGVLEELGEEIRKDTCLPWHAHFIPVLCFYINNLLSWYAVN